MIKEMDSGESVPNPDPTKRTVEQLLREIATSREIVEAKAIGSREVLETRLGGMDVAIQLLQQATDRIPAHVKDSVEHLRVLHDERFNSLSSQMDIRFDGIATQFLERDKRTEQLSLADKTAIAAALQAQKEAAGATTEMVIAAINKIDMNFSKLIEQTQNLLTTSARNLDEKINDLKGRFDRGEGRGSVSDPAMSESLSRLMAAVQSLNESRDRYSGVTMGQSAMQATNQASNSFLVAVVVAAIAMAGLIFSFINGAG